MWKVPHIFKKDWRESSYYSSLADLETLGCGKILAKSEVCPTSHTDPFQKGGKHYLKWLSTNFWPMSYVEQGKPSRKTGSKFLFIFLKSSRDFSDLMQEDKLCPNWSSQFTEQNQQQLLSLREKDQNPQFLQTATTKPGTDVISRIARLYNQIFPVLALVGYLS